MKLMNESMKTISFPSKCWTVEALGYVSVRIKRAAADIISIILEKNKNEWLLWVFTNRNKDTIMKIDDVCTGSVQSRK